MRMMTRREKKTSHDNAMSFMSIRLKGYLAAASEVHSNAGRQHLLKGYVAVIHQF